MRKFVALFLCMCVAFSQLLAQNRTVTGKVTDEKGNPVSAASVRVKGSTKGVTTDAGGSFSLTVPSTAKTLLISSVNFALKEVSIGSGNNIMVALVSTTESLQDVVVTGYSTKKKTEFTGATSKVASKQIEQVPIASFEQILQGRAPGLYIASGSGQPGSSARVNIRGVGSISGGTSPLYVLDGIPIEEGVFRTLNPNDFESVDVLKDASGAGQYGSRGANGVIVITSKKGLAGKIQLQYRGQTGFSAPPSLNNVRLMNTEERLNYEENFLGGPIGILGSTALTGYPGWDYSTKNPRYQSLSPTQRAAEALLLDSIRKINTDWADIMFKNSLFRQHEVSAQGGAQGFSFFTSLSAYNQAGILDRSNLDRYTFRANVDFKTERLIVSVRSFAGYSKQAGIESEGGVALANPVAAAYLELPYRALRKADGTIDFGAGKTGPNAYDRIYTTTSNINQFKGTLGVTLQYKIWDGLSFKTTNGIDWRNNNTDRFIDPNSFAGRNISFGNLGSYNEGISENLQLISTTGLTYSKTFAGKHNVNAMVMYEAIKNKFRSFNATGFGLNLRLPNTPAAISAGSATNNMIPQVGGSKTLNGLSSTFGLVDYTYDKRYTLSASLRKDVPSQVPMKNRDNVFYTVGFSWNVLNESFMTSQKIFQDLRFRASYGESANANGFVSNFGYISTYGPTAVGYAGAAGIIPTSPGNEDYKLESQLLTNVGFDASLLDKRLRITADYYIKNSQNLFVDQPLSRTTGFTSLSTNAAKVQNRGLDFKVDYDVVYKQDFIVTVGINGGFLKNEVKSLGSLNEIPQGTGIIRVGLPIGSHFAVGWVGVDPATGNPIYQDIDGKPTSVYSAANNRATFGTFLPTFTGGASLDVIYKGFSISALFTTAQDVQRFNNESFFYETTNSNFQFNKRVDMLNSWLTAGQATNYQRINSQRQFSSKDIQDASFVRFRNLQVGYTATIKNQKIGIRSIRVWGQGSNLYTWTKWQGFDPEESNNIATYEFPNPRTFTLGLDINF